MNREPTRMDQGFDLMHDAVRRIAAEVAAPHAADVDARARFPSETVGALREAGLLSAGVPREFGGAGCGLEQQAQLCATLAQACGSSAMVLAMHYIQLACIARHGLGSEFFRGYLRDVVARQYLLASMTSEVGTFGETRTSVCAVRREGGRFTLDKDATTGSYCAHADAILVTSRSGPDAPGADQVLVLVRREDCTLTQTTSWDTLGMRGTCSPGFRLESAGPAEQVLPGAFADSSAQTMVPYSHVLWSSLWWGIAADAVAKAANFVRGQARQNPGTPPPTATRLAEVSLQLQNMKQLWLSAARDFDALGNGPQAGEPLLSMGWALRLNNLKISCSEAAPQIVHRALQIVGILGYKNDSPFSLGRQYRDSLSASLMISNDRIAAKSASMLLVFKDAP
jgi:acyl-CoA dehydrogenase